MDDATVGRAMRSLRIKRGWRQSDLAAAADVSQSLVSRAERGHFEMLSIRTVRAIFAALDAGCTLAPWWRSGQLDRLLDEGHAALAARATEVLERAGWHVDVEVTFSIYGERGSIDIVGTRPVERRALMGEVKTAVLSTEELNRSADKKTRLLPRIVNERYGWAPTAVSRLLIVDDTSTNRRRVGRAAVLDTTFPIRGDRAAAWLRDGASGGAALIFLSPRTPGTHIQRNTSSERVRPGSSRTNRRHATVLGGPQRG